MSVHLPTLRDTALQSISVCTCFNIDPPCLQNMIRHRFESRGTVHFERYTAAGRPSCEDEIRIANRVIGVEVRSKSDLQVGRLKGGNAPVENSRLCPTHHTRSKIDEIGVLVNHNGSRRTGAVRIGNGLACTEQYDLRAVCAFLR